MLHEDALRTTINNFTQASAMGSAFFGKQGNCIDISPNPNNGPKMELKKDTKTDQNVDLDLHIFHAKKKKCLSAHATLWSAMFS